MKLSPSTTFISTQQTTLSLPLRLHNPKCSSIGIGDTTARYYCFPKDKKDVVCKARLAQEEIYKLNN